MDSESGQVMCGLCGTSVPVNQVVQLGGKTVCVQCKPRLAREMAGTQPAPQGVSFRYGGFWIRFVALVVDGIILMVPMVILMFAMGVAMAPMDDAEPTAADVGLALLPNVIQIVLGVAYYTFFVGRFGATPGKMILRLKVVRSDGSPVSYGRAAGRYLSASFVSALCLIGYIIAAFDDEKRSLHDRICDTRVVYR